MPQNQIPANPEVSQQQAAAGHTPVQVHQGAPQGIPAHPGVVQQQMPARSAAMDFFSQVAMGDDDPAPIEPQAPISSPTDNTDLVNVDDLLSGGEFQQSVAQQAPATEPQQAPTQPVAQQPTPQPQTPAPASQPQQSPEDMQKAAIDYLRGSVYNFDDETARRALTEPETVLPNLAARLHVNLVQEFAQQIHRVVPMLVERETQRRMAVMEAKNEFFRQYPKLNRPEWSSIVADSIGMAARLHEGKTRQEVMREGAALAAYRIRSMAPRPPAAQGRPAPFVPASPGSGGPIVPTNPQQQSNPWAELSADPDLMTGW